MGNFVVLENNLVIYIAADSRSGSTLLDLLLGNHDSIVSVGELRRLAEHYNGSLACTCGLSVDQCGFWRDVESHLNSSSVSMRDLETLLPRSRSLLADLAYFLPARMLHYITSRGGSIAQAGAIARNDLQILDALCATNNTHIVVDSSKVPKLCRLYNLLKPGEIKTIFLTRDGRGTCNSRKQHGVRFFRATLVWISSQIKFFFLRYTIPPSDRITIRYEDLCRDPKQVIGSICRFIGVPFQENCTKLVKTGKHNICGNPMRFDSGATDIQLDEKWREQLSKSELRQFNFSGAGLINWLLGYR